MITPKIRALFDFIAFLYQNTENFSQYNELIAELIELNDERQKVLFKRTHKEKLRFDEIQAQLEPMFQRLKENTSDLIKDKAAELAICTFDNEPSYNFGELNTEISHLKSNFNPDDVVEVLKYKNYYSEYREKTHRNFLSLSFFFSEFEQILEGLFEYFIDENEVSDTLADQIDLPLPHTEVQTASQKYLESIRLKRLATEVDVERMSQQRVTIKLGDELTYTPQPTTKDELFERFYKYYAQSAFESILRVFHAKFGDSPTQKILTDELNEINKFIAVANKLSVREAFDRNSSSQEYEYLRLTNKYYENENRPLSSYHTYFHTNASFVFAKCILFKKWLESELEKLKDRQEMTLDRLIAENKQAALSLDLADYATMNQPLKILKTKLENAEFENEKDEVIAKAKEAISKLKEALNLFIANENYKGTFTGHTPQHIWNIRFLFEYRELLERAFKPQREAATETNPPIKERHNQIFKVKDYKNQLLFRVGFLFATGAMNKYFSINGNGETFMKKEFTAPKIANELGNNSLNKFVLASINNYPSSKENGKKNIFNSLDMMKKVIAHCDAAQIPIDPYFLSRLPTE